MTARFIYAYSLLVGFAIAAPASAQLLYMNPNNGTLYNGNGLPASGPNPGRALQYNSMPSYQRNYIMPDGSTRNGYGLPTSGPNPRMTMCLQNPGLC
jgi:hypothetical protein